MNETPTTTPGSMFCRQCGYQLTGLSENRCPECGRAFDPAHRQTYLRHPKAWSRRRWLRRVAVLLMCLLVLFGGRLGWVYWQWRTERAAITAMCAHGGMYRTSKPNGPAWLGYHLLPMWFRQLGCRVSAGYFDHASIHDADMSHLAQLENLQELNLGHTQITDAGMVHLSRLKQLWYLTLKGTRITDTGLAHLAQLENLRTLDLSDTQVTDEGMAILAHLRQLQHLGLKNTPVSDASLTQFLQSSQLEGLDLSGTAVTDKGLGCLPSLSQLRWLRLPKTRITHKGLAHLTGLSRLGMLSLSEDLLTTTVYEQWNALVDPLPRCTLVPEAIQCLDALPSLRVLHVHGLTFEHRQEIRKVLVPTHPGIAMPDSDSSFLPSCFWFE